MESFRTFRGRVLGRWSDSVALPTVSLKQTLCSSDSSRWEEHTHCLLCLQTAGETDSGQNSLPGKRISSIKQLKDV